MHFTYEIEDSQGKIIFAYDVYISRNMQVKNFHIWKTIFLCEMACEIFIRV